VYGSGRANEKFSVEHETFCILEILRKWRRYYANYAVRMVRSLKLWPGNWRSV
jgi:hypothetical protein